MARRVGKVEHPVRLIAAKLTVHVSVERLGTEHHERLTHQEYPVVALSESNDSEIGQVTRDCP